MLQEWTRVTYAPLPAPEQGVGCMLYASCMRDTPFWQHCHGSGLEWTTPRRPRNGFFPEVFLVVFVLCCVDPRANSTERRLQRLWFGGGTDQGRRRVQFLALQRVENVVYVVSSGVLEGYLRANRLRQHREAKRCEREPRLHH